MKRFFQVFGIGFLALIIFVAISLYRDCGTCLQEQDYKFMKIVKSNLDAIGSSIKVSDIYSGEWTKVCATSGGFDYDLSRKPNPDGKGSSKRIILNDSFPYLTDRYNESAVIFHYGENELGQEQIEIFRMTPDQIRYEGPEIPKTDCILKGDAFFQVKWNEKYREKETAATTRSSDFMVIRLRTH